MKKMYIWTLVVLFFMGCSSHYKYWDLAKFKINPTALQEGEEVKIIYTSQGPGNNEELSYFIHLIVVSQSSGDTINLLTTINNGLEPNGGDEVFNFIGKEDAMAHLVHQDLSDVTDIKDLERFDKIDFESIKKVARDPDFDDIADNTYPSIIGYIGKVSKPAN